MVHFSNVFHSHRHARRAAPVPDGKREGGQHVFHDLSAPIGTKVVLVQHLNETEDVNVTSGRDAAFMDP